MLKDQAQTFIIGPDSDGTATTVQLRPCSRALLCASCWCATDLNGASWCPACGRPPPADGWPSMPYSFRTRYTFTEQIACNADAAVFRAISVGATGDSHVLVKVARDGGNTEGAKRIKKAFRREAAVAGLLSDDSASFVSVRGTDSEDPAYLALEHVPWPTLDATLAQAGVLSSREVASLGIEILRGVGCLEKQRLVHGNLVPKNIHVSRRKDGDYEVKIAGAGADLSKQGDSAGGPKSACAHTSPEQWAGKAPCTSSDIYMVASMLWELATGSVPHPLSDHAVSSADRLLSLHLALQKPEAMPSELYDLLARLLRFDPADRFAIALESASPGASLLAAGVERELHDFLSASSREQEHARRTLEEMSQEVADLHEQLAPLGRLVNRAVEIEATLRRLLDEPAGASLTSTYVEELRGSLRELASDVEAQRPAAALRDAWSSSPSSPPAGLPVRSLKSYLLPTLVAAIAGFSLGFGVSHPGVASHSSAAPPISASSAQPSLREDTAPPVPLASATASSAPAASTSAASSARAEPSAAPLAGTSAIQAATAPTPAKAAPVIRRRVLQPDAYDEPTPAPAPEDDPY